MAVTSKVLSEVYNVENAATPITYYSADGVTAVIDKFVARNHTTSPATLTIAIGDVNVGFPAESTIIEKTLAAGESYSFPEMVGQVIPPDGSLGMMSSTLNSINVRVSGREIN